MLILLAVMTSCAELNSFRCDYATVHGIESHDNGLALCGASK